MMPNMRKRRVRQQHEGALSPLDPCTETNEKTRPRIAPIHQKVSFMRNRSAMLKPIFPRPEWYNPSVELMVVIASDQVDAQLARAVFDVGTKNTPEPES